MASIGTGAGLTDAQMATVSGIAQTLQQDPGFLAAFQKAAASQQTKSAPAGGTTGALSTQQLIAALDQIKAMLQSGAGSSGGVSSGGVQSGGGTGNQGWPPATGPVTKSPIHAAAAAAAVGLA